MEQMNETTQPIWHLDENDVDALEWVNEHNPVVSLLTWQPQALPRLLKDGLVVEEKRCLTVSPLGLCAIDLYKARLTICEMREWADYTNKLARDIELRYGPYNGPVMAYAPIG